ncbi:Uncharacterised protein [Mycoplasmopsis maculosa]|uniref:Uncharacterized protein n=1 Tax=Mycoplasmopsis maculosa TaxID=114885 RepID=A0A449B3Y6_9BACT|nr:hypothetical protein [Mycoplasmopsis maculosa]VEU75312.1 Uncharacterised protein [Mycoplasmopsis maculosa]
MNIVWKIENLMKRKGTNLDIDYKNSYISVPNIREVSNIAWPNVKYAAQIFRRFSPNKFISNANRKASFDHGWITWQQQHFHSQYFGGGGASGSGLFMDGDIFAGAWNSGSNGNFDGFYSGGPKYATRDFNYLGINFNNENPFTLNNVNSFAAQILRANLKKPNEYDLPWFFREY